MQHPFLAWLPHGADWLYILIIVLVLFGSSKLPQLARGLGKSLGEFKKAKEDFDKEIHSATAEAETRKLDDKSPAPTDSIPSTDSTSKKI